LPFRRQKSLSAKKPFSSLTNFVWDDIEEDDDDDDPFSIPSDKPLKALGKYKSIRSVKTLEV
jgi:hypothetical protein